LIIVSTDINKVLPALEDINLYSSKIISHISEFHQYEYDDFIEPVTTIWNGRFGMYNVGNEVAMLWMKPAFFRKCCIVIVKKII